MKTLLIDDMRDIQADVIARTYDEGIDALENEGSFDILFLDHDLGCYDENGIETNGYHILCWLEENREYLPGKIVLVTANPVGRVRMIQVIKRLYGLS